MKDIPRLELQHTPPTRNDKPVAAHGRKADEQTSKPHDQARRARCHRLSNQEQGGRRYANRDSHQMARRWGEEARSWRHPCFTPRFVRQPVTATGPSLKIADASQARKAVYNRDAKLALSQLQPVTLVDRWQCHVAVARAGHIPNACFGAQ